MKNEEDKLIDKIKEARPEANIDPEFRAALKSNVEARLGQKQGQSQGVKTVGSYSSWVFGLRFAVVAFTIVLVVGVSREYVSAPAMDISEEIRVMESARTLSAPAAEVQMAPGARMGGVPEAMDEAPLMSAPANDSLLHKFESEENMSDSAAIVPLAASSTSATSITEALPAPDSIHTPN